MYDQISSGVYEKEDKIYIHFFKFIDLNSLKSKKEPRLTGTI